MKLDALDLRHFATIVQAGGISPAARKLGQQKSTLSRALATLEARLGVRLLQRTTRKLSLTEAGELLLGYAQRVAEELEHAEAALEGLSDAPQGALVVTLPQAFLRHVLAPRLPEFLAAQPGIRLTLLPSTQVLDLVAAGIDLAIRVGEPTGATAVARPLLSTPQVLVAAPGYLARAGTPRSSAQLAKHELLQIGERAGPIAWFGAEGPSLQARVALPEPGLLIDLLLAGAGIGAVPQLYAAPLLADGRLVRVLPRFALAPRTLYALYPSRHQLAPKVRAFLDWLVEVCFDQTVK